MRDRVVLWVFLLVVAPVGAAVVISALLLFGAPPRVVFTPGRLLVAGFASAGIHAPRPVGVLATVACFWAAIVAFGFLLARIRGHRRIGA